MNLTERAREIVLLSRALEECVMIYDTCKGGESFKPMVGYCSNGVELEASNSANAIGNRIKVLRSELLKLSKAL